MSIQVDDASGPLGSASVVHMLTGYSPEHICIKACAPWYVLAGNVRPWPNLICV